MIHIYESREALKTIQSFPCNEFSLQIPSKTRKSLGVLVWMDRNTLSKYIVGSAGYIRTRSIILPILYHDLQVSYPEYVCMYQLYFCT